MHSHVALLFYIWKLGKRCTLTLTDCFDTHVWQLKNVLVDEIRITGTSERKIKGMRSRPKHLNVEIPVRQISTSNPPKQQRIEDLIII